jgi:hypothetical protein
MNLEIWKGKTRKNKHDWWHSDVTSSFDNIIQNEMEKTKDMKRL